MPMGGGTSSKSDSLVKFTDPTAALQAGELGAQGSYAAAQLANQSINDAINQLNTQYQSAITGLQPYSQTGVQALDQLNQYLQLNPYMPSQVPTAPTAPTLASLASQVTPSQIVSYIQGNMSLGGINAQGHQYDETNYVIDPITGYVNTSSAPGVTPYMSPQAFLNSQGGVSGGSLGTDVTQYLAQQEMPQAQKQYQSDLTQYKQNLANYNQDQQWATQYGTPLTSAQITQNIANQPGFQAQLQQSTQTINNDAAARGYIGSGAILQELANLGQSQMASYYQNTLSNLASVASSGQTAATQVGSLTTGLGNNVAGLLTQQGQNNANSVLSGSNSLMNGLISASQQYKTIPLSSSSSGGGELGGIGQLAGGLGSLKSVL